MAAMNMNKILTSSLLEAFPRNLGIQSKSLFMLLCASVLIAGCNLGSDSDSSVTAEAVPGQDARAALAAARAAVTQNAEAAVAASGIDPQQEADRNYELSLGAQEIERLRVQAENIRLQENQDLRSANETASIANEALRIESEVTQAELRRDQANYASDNQVLAARERARGQVEAARASQPGAIETLAQPTATLAGAALQSASGERIAKLNAQSNMNLRQSQEAYTSARQNLATAERSIQVAQGDQGLFTRAKTAASSGQVANITAREAQWLGDQGIHVVSEVTGRDANGNAVYSYKIPETHTRADGTVVNQSAALEFGIEQAKERERKAKQLRTSANQTMQDFGEYAPAEQLDSGSYSLLGDDPNGALSSAELEAMNLEQQRLTQVALERTNALNSIRQQTGVSFEGVNADELTADELSELAHKAKIAGKTDLRWVGNTALEQGVNSRYEAAATEARSFGYDTPALVGQYQTQKASGVDHARLQSEVAVIREFDEGLSDMDVVAWASLSESDRALAYEGLRRSNPAFEDLSYNQFGVLSHADRGFLAADPSSLAEAAEGVRTDGGRAFVEQTLDGEAGDVHKGEAFVDPGKLELLTDEGFKPVYDVCSSIDGCLEKANEVNKVINENGKIKVGDSEIDVLDTRRIEGATVGENNTAQGHAVNAIKIEVPEDAALRAELNIPEDIRAGDEYEILLDATGSLLKPGELRDAEGQPILADSPNASQIAYEDPEVAGGPTETTSTASPSTDTATTDVSSPDTSSADASSAATTESTNVVAPTSDVTTPADSVATETSTAAPQPGDSNFVGPLPEDAQVDVAAELSVDTNAPTVSETTALDTPNEPELYGPPAPSDIESELAVNTSSSAGTAGSIGGSSGSAGAAAASVGGGAAAASAATAIASAAPNINTNINNNSSSSTSNAGAEDIGVGVGGTNVDDQTGIRPALNSSNVTPVRYNCAGSAGTGESSGACAQLETAIQTLTDLQGLAADYNQQVEQLGEEEDKKEELEQQLSDLDDPNSQEAQNLRNELDATVQNIASLKDAISENRTLIEDQAGSIQISGRNGFLDGDNQVANDIEAAAARLAGSVSGDDYALADTSGIKGNTLAAWAPGAENAIDDTLNDLRGEGRLGYGSSVAQNGSGSGTPSDFRGDGNGGSIVPFR